MGFELRAKNKEIDDITAGWMSWSLFLQETGMGYVLGYGTGFKPGTYVYSAPESNVYFQSPFDSIKSLLASKGLDTNKIYVLVRRV